MTIQTALLQGAEILEKGAISPARLTAEVLLCHAMHCERAYLYAHCNDDLTQLGWIHYGRYLHERLKGKPTQYITHRQEFFGREFYVNQDVLIPRPETEHLVEAALAYLKAHPHATALDLGTGSGAIAISLAIESQSRIIASDISIQALAVAKRNCEKHQAPVSLFAGDLLEPVRPRSIDLLISNPPYVPGADAANMQREVRDWEPHIALFAGDTGFEIYERLIRGSELNLKRGGRLLMELGYRSLEGVREMLTPAWSDIEVISDLAGLPRVIGATLRSS
ncbi:MAG: peptide chain release factor N(5)-glutamine methyltransferase [Acidobacteriaceae bacterium]|nr:peptide chain release factor N(5)-glutamine methyltransferase [Acidobacteriaceae bacterium]MBV9781599.1 peptide chain release factor N(5)-glutamine methyltransferase [Acidobacteriaceae bacterium]